MFDEFLCIHEDCQLNGMPITFEKPSTLISILSVEPASIDIGSLRDHQQIHLFITIKQESSAWKISFNEKTFNGKRYCEQLGS